MAAAVGPRVWGGRGEEARQAVDKGEPALPAEGVQVKALGERMD